MAKPIRILQVFASLNVGGAESRMMDVYRFINREKVQFDFVTLSNEKQFFENEITLLGGKIFKITNPRNNGSISNLRTLVKIMKKGEYKAVHAHTSYHCGIVTLASKIAGIKIRISHARTTGTIQKGLLAKIQVLIGKILIKLFSNKFLCISKASGVFLFGKKYYSKNKVIYLPNAINLDNFKEVGSYDNVLESNLNNNIVIGHIGRFSKMKNQEFLVDIFNELHKEKPNSKLIFVGDGLLKEKVVDKVHKENLTNHVIFTGVRKDIPYILSKIDVLVMPSIYEGLGGVVIESQAAGIPSVVSTALPDEVDLGLDIVKKVSLDYDIQYWIKVINNVLGKKIKDRILIRKKFEEKGYTIEQESKFLIEKIYDVQNY